ncbi:MAG: type II toxin-antitoxin system RelE/ParE family toxin [Oscillospiraceae bacterium]|nr:type II toxin-antitoxin system RelE/ParE family toxin [Oscillospiraceae bacterium]
MAYHVEFTKSALRDIKKLDKGTSALILGWIRKNLEGCSDPRIHGKGLTANRSGQWRYRVGDYRIIADIDDSRIVVVVVRIGHRRDIYDRC